MTIAPVLRFSQEGEASSRRVEWSDALRGKQYDAARSASFNMGLQPLGIASARVSLRLCPAAEARRYGCSGNLGLFAGWYRTVTDSTADNLLMLDNISLAGMWTKWLGGGAAAVMLTTLASLAALGLGAAVWLKRDAGTSPRTSRSPCCCCSCRFCRPRDGTTCCS